MSKLWHYSEVSWQPGSWPRIFCTLLHILMQSSEAQPLLVACSQDLVTTKLNQCECWSTDQPTHLCWYKDLLNTEAQLHLLLISTAVTVCRLQVLQHWRVLDLLLDILAVCKSVFCNVLAVRRANLKLNIDRQGVCWLPGCWAHSSSRPANTAPCAGSEGSKEL